MALHRLSENSQVVANFSIAITAATTNGTAVDTQGFREASAVFYSIPSGSGTTSNCKLQESDDTTSADFVDVPDAAFAASTTAAVAAPGYLDIDLSQRKRYLRLVHTGAGGSAAGVATGLFILFRPWYSAPAQTTAAVQV